MLFVSPVFLLLFLPIVLGIYALTPNRIRPRVICIFGLAFYTIANLETPASILFLMLCAVFTYCATFAVFSVRKRSVMIFCITIVVGVLAVLRYLGIWADESAARQFIPIGASFYLLASVSCIVDVSRGDAKMPRTFIDVLTYLTFFPVIIAGPIIKYKHFEQHIKPENLRYSAADIGSGVIIFARGFIKRVAIAALIDETYDSIASQLINRHNEPVSLILAFILSVLLLVGVYFSFSGYSDMGRGIAAMLGIRINPDFGACLFAYSPKIYFRNFMSSLTLWIDDYIRTPLANALKLESKQGNSKRIAAAIVSVAGALSLLLWFKIGISAMPAIALLLLPSVIFPMLDLDEKLKASKHWRWLGWLFTMAYAAVFWLIVKTRDLSSLLVLYGNLTIFQPLQSFTVFNAFDNLEIPLVVLITLIVELPVIIGMLTRRRQSSILRTQGFRWVWSLLILAIFVASIYYYLPQYPDLASAPFRDIIF